MNHEQCPCCPNHCEKNNLGCGRGKEYFDSNKEPKTIEEQVIMDLRKCGHLLHHNKDLNSSHVLSGFSVEELNQLHQLLSKIYCHFESI